MAIDWTQINSQLSDPTKGVNTALKGVSNAGTVFGDLRQSILNEQQRAVENADREKVFDESVRQFEINQENIDRAFDEGVRQVDRQFAFDVEKLGRLEAENAKDRALKDLVSQRDTALGYARVNASNAGINLQRQAFELARQKEQEEADYLRNFIATNEENRNFNAQNTQNKALQNINNLNRILGVPVNTEATDAVIESRGGVQAPREFYATETEADRAARMGFAAQTGRQLGYSPYAQGATMEQALALKNAEVKQKQQETFTNNLYTAQKDIDNPDVQKAYTLWSGIAQTDLDALGDPRIAVQVLNRESQQTGGWFSKGALDKFEQSIKNNTYKTDPVYQNLMAAMGNPIDLGTATNINTSTAKRNEATLNNAIAQNVTKTSLQGLSPEAITEVRNQLTTINNENIKNSVPIQDWNTKYQEILNNLVSTFGFGMSFDRLDKKRQKDLSDMAEANTQTFFVNQLNSNIKTMNNKLNELNKTQSGSILNRPIN